MPLCAGVLILLFVLRPSIGRGRGRWLDWFLLACLVAAAAQLIPLSPALRDPLSPNAYVVQRALALGAAPQEPAAAPLSLDPASTAWALALGAMYIGLFWCAREIYGHGGVRTTIRVVAMLGLALTTLVAVQRATAPKLLYWVWQPLSAGASPYGPFVNRNALAGWLAMAVPLAIGYALARSASRGPVFGGLAARIAALDATQLLLGGSACLMMGGLLGSLSRGGIFGGAAGLVVFVALSQSRATEGRAMAGVAAGVAAIVAVGAMYANLGALAMRMQETTELGEWGRRAIWRDTAAMIRDFPLTGVGAGAFERGMLVYQSGSRQFFFNHAHNEYLQIVAEGGLLVAVPAALALIAAAVAVVRRLREDYSPMFWIRAGAVAGIVAVAVQSVFDTGLRTPANGVLFAVIAAIALHEREPRIHGDRTKRNSNRRDR